MIFDHIDNRKTYYSIDPRIEKAFDYILSMDLATPPGRYELDGDDFFVLVLHPEKKDLTGVPLEYHKNYIDLQAVVKGGALFGYAPLSQTGEAVIPYDAKKDAGHNADKGSLYIPASQGKFFMFWPHDGHKGVGDEGTPGDLIQLCFKLRIR